VAAAARYEGVERKEENVSSSSLRTEEKKMERITYHPSRRRDQRLREGTRDEREEGVSKLKYEEREKDERRTDSDLLSFGRSGGGSGGRISG